MRKLLIGILILYSFRIMAFDMTLIDTKVIPIPDEYVLYPDRVGSKSSMIFDDKYLYIATHTNERIKTQELLSSNTEITKQYVIRIEIATGKIDIIGKPGTYAPDGYMMVSHIMLSDDEFFIKTTGQFNVYDKQSLQHKYNISMDISTNNYAIISQDKLYSTSNDAGNMGQDFIGVILKCEPDLEYPPDQKLVKIRDFLPYQRYVRQFKLHKLKDNIYRRSGVIPSDLELRMAESYRSEGILQDWSHLIYKGNLYSAPAIGTDIYQSSPDGELIKSYPLNNFKPISKNEIKTKLNENSQGAKFSRLVSIYADKRTDELLLYYWCAKSSRSIQERFGLLSLWSIDQHKEINELIPVDFFPIAIDANVVTGLRVVNINDLEMVRYVISK